MICYKERTASKTYMKVKLDKFYIDFYDVVGWPRCYLHSLLNNGSGNKTSQALEHHYNTMFRELRGCVQRKIDGKVVVQSTQYKLLCTQVAHRTKVDALQYSSRLFVMDSFYTRGVCGKKMHKFSDGARHILDTIRFTNVDDVNCSNL